MRTRSLFPQRSTTHLPNADDVHRFLTQEKEDANVIVPHDQITNARRHIKSIIEGAGSTCVYAQDAWTLNELQFDVGIKDGKCEPTDGLFRKLLASGGTLLLDVSSRDGVPRFPTQMLEAFNTLMEEQRWQGEKLPCLEKGKRVRVLFLCDPETTDKKLLSGAQYSRTTRRDYSGYAFPEASDPPIEQAQSHLPGSVKLIDLQYDPSWSRQLFGGPEIDESQNWYQAHGELHGFEFDQTLVLRNPPQDPQLMDLLLSWQKVDKPVRLEAGLPPEEAAARLAGKTPAANILHMLQNQDASICSVNAANIAEVLKPHYSFQNGKLKKCDSQLARLQSNGHTPVVYVTGKLPPHLWDQLMLHPMAFSVAVAPGVDVPAEAITRYRDHVHCMAKPMAALAHLESWPRDPVPNASVSFMHSLDPTLLDKYFPTGNTTRLVVTPTMHRDALLYTLRQKKTTSTDASELLSRTVKERPLIKDLRNGKTVILQGLENNPELSRELATLLHPPHYLYVNGERLSFGENGGLSGRLIVVSPDKKWIGEHSLSPAYRDPIDANAWRSQVGDRLAAEFRMSPDVVQQRLTPLFKLYDVLGNLGCLPKKQPPAPYAMIETQFRHLFSDQAGQPGVDEAQQRLFRSLFKDMLIAEHCETKGVRDTRYAQLKACLKVLFPDEMKSAMPPLSLDREQLDNLLTRVHDAKDIEEFAWQFLNVFSPDVIHGIVGDNLSQLTTPDTQATMRKKVLLLVCEQARHHDLKLPPLLKASMPTTPTGTGMTAYDRPEKLPRAQKNLDKAKLAQSQGQAIFLKGPPGAGKTHLTQSLASGEVFMANIADEGTGNFEQRLKDWAKHEPPATLVIDEANLAEEGNLRMLESVFSDHTLFGRRHQLSNEHHILFTGNADHLPGRTLQQVVKNSFVTLHFKALPPEFLRKEFIDPLLNHAAGTPALSRVLDDTLKESIASQVLHVHARLQEAQEQIQERFPDFEVSPRDLEECVAQLLCYVPQLASKGAVPTPEVMSPVLARIALNVYTKALPDAYRSVVEAWLRHDLKLPSGEALPTLYDAGDITNMLKKAGLAPTSSTVELAGSVDWWLRSHSERGSFSHKSNTLGKGALLIEGPASRGKDTVVTAVLQSQGKKEGSDFIHLNADPNDLQHLRDTLTNAYKTGQIVLISELNLLPSGIVEGELNALLTGQADKPPAPGFAVISTTNPGYAGRESFSAALKNRMETISIIEYAQEELPEIARALVSSLRRENMLTSPRPTSPRPAGIDADKLDDLVGRHRALLKDLDGQPEEYRPGTRQLRGAIRSLRSDQNMTVDAAFEKIYGNYLALTGRRYGNTANAMQRAAQNQDEQARQLRFALALSHPHWLRYPSLEADAGLSQDTPVFYDAATRRLRFNPRRDMPELCEALLALTKNGLPSAPGTRLVAAPITPEATSAALSRHGMSPETSMQSVVTDANEPAFSAASTAPQSRLTADSVAPIQLPSLHRQSGVGTPDRQGYIGRILKPDLTATYLNHSQQTLDGNGVGMRAQFPEDPAAKYADADEQIELQDVQIWNTPSGKRVTLLAPSHRRPAQVRLDGLPATTVHRDESGVWYVEAAGHKSSISALSYRLIPHPQESAVEPALHVDLPDLTPSYNKDLGERIAQLKQQAQEQKLSRPEIVAELKAIFAATLEYSHDDAAALQGAADLAAYCQRFLSEGQGVCAEFSTSFAAILEQTFKIPTRVCSGYRAQAWDGRISAQAHAWVEYCDEQGQWRIEDPTGHRANGTFDSTGWSVPDFIVDTAAAADVLERFSLEALGLKRSALRRGGELLNAFHGRVDIKQFLLGKKEFFRLEPLDTVEQPQSIVIDDLPALHDRQALFNFCMKMAKPLAALLQSGVPILVRDAQGNLQPAADVADILESHRHAGDAPSGKDREGRLVVNAQNWAFLDRLASHYYESVLAAKGVDVNDDNAVKTCLLDEFVDALKLDGSRRTQLPIELVLHGRTVTLTEQDVLGMLEQATRSLDDLSKRDTPPGTLAAVIASDLDQAKAIRQTLEHLIQLAKLPEVKDAKGRQARRDALRRDIYCNDWLEYTPELDSVVLIEGLLNLETSENRLELLRSLSESTRPKTPDVKIAIAMGYADLFSNYRCQPNELEIAIGDIRDAFNHASSAQRATLLYRLFHAFELEPRNYRRDPENVLFTIGYKDLCDLYASAKDDFSAKDKAMILRNFANVIGRRDDTDYKDWILAHADSFCDSAEFPLKSILGTMGMFVNAINWGNIGGRDSQAKVATILERLAQSRHALSESDRHRLVDDIRTGITARRIVPDLIPRFEALIVQIENRTA